MDIPQGGAFSLAVNVVILVGFWTMCLRFPTPLARDERPLLGVALAAGLIGNAFSHVPPFLSAAAAGDVASLGLTTFWFIVSAGILTGIILFPLRAWKLPSFEASAVRSIAVFSVGTALFRGFGAALVPAAARGDVPLAAAVDPVLGFALPAILWVAVAARGAHARLARNTVLALALVVVAALALSRASWGSALLGLAGALLLGFAILRGQIDGLDLKVRWGINRSTVAAAFIAAFFVLSEGAQILFGQGNEWVGLLGAGALVFAIAPLQRAAERLAEKAVPSGAGATAAPAGLDGEDTYRRAVVWATRDNVLAHDEERHLLVIATRLGITPERAFDIRNEVQSKATDAPEVSD